MKENKTKRNQEKIVLITTDTDLLVCVLYYQRHGYGFAVTLRNPSRLFADLKQPLALPSTPLRDYCTPRRQRSAQSRLC